MGRRASLLAILLGLLLARGEVRVVGRQGDLLGGRVPQHASKWRVRALDGFGDGRWIQHRQPGRRGPLCIPGEKQVQHNDGGYWSQVWNEFARQFGAKDGKEALSGFAGMVKGLQCHARRAVRHHRPCCPCLAEWLVQPEGAGELLQSGSRLAQVMRRHALHLPERAAAEPPDRATRRPEPLGVTVH